MKSIIQSAMLIITLTLAACQYEKAPIMEVENEGIEIVAQEPAVELNSFLSIFEIPATDITRAVAFYQAILDLEIEQMDMPGMQMGIFPYEGQVISGVIIKAEGYVPSAEGVTIYLNGGDDLQIILDRVAENGGTVIVQKTPHADESGFFAMFLDSEGNRLGLHSPN